MKIEIKVELDTIEDKDIGSEFVDLLILIAASSIVMGDACIFRNSLLVH